MKKITLFAALLAVRLTIGSAAEAQVNIRVNIGGNRPVMAAPVMAPDFDCYYYPDVNVYFDARNRQYRYYDQGRWITGRDLPAAYRYRDFDHMRRTGVTREYAFRQDMGRGYDMRRNDNQYNQYNQYGRDGGRDQRRGGYGNDRGWNVQQRDDRRNDGYRFRG